MSSCGCALLPTRTIVEPPPPCPELTEEALEALMTKSDPLVVDWYWNQMDPYCEALYNATRGEPDGD